jgi:Type III restriction enzyme, res subunit
MPITLQPHQEYALQQFIASPNRGMALVHGAGSGKTFTAIAVAEHLKQYKEVLVIAPKSLHDNMRNSFEKYSKSVDPKRYRFISSNANNVIDKLETTTDELTGVDVKSLRLDNKLLIVDEAHNLLNGMSNGSKQASALYDMLMKAKNCRILLMTASPIINNIYEAAIALNICKGPIKTEDGEMTTLLPESADDFYRYFLDEKAMKLKNVDKLRNRIRGLVSYKGDLFERHIPDFYEMLKTTVKKEHYPDYTIKVLPVHMSNLQYSAYEQAREKERLETQRAITGSGIQKGDRIVLNPSIKSGGESYRGYKVNEQEIKDASYISGGELKRESAFKSSTSYRIKSRQLSNVFYPESDKVDIYDKIETYAPKLKAVGDKLKPGVKAIIYSNFIKSGLEPMAKYLEVLGYSRYDPSNPSSKGIHGMYGVYTGDVPVDDRTATLKEYNKPNSALTILLISSSGAEGLSTLRTRQCHILESYWNWQRTYQVMHRAIRYRSHETLPEKERNVKVYIYLAIPPKDVKATEQTTDVYLFTQSAKKQEINDQMVNIMASVSVDCDKFNNESNFKCFHCEPRNGAPLYLADLNKDMRYPLPCANKDKPVNAKEISISGQMYYLTKDNRVFTQSKDQSYEEILDKDIKEWVLAKV